MPGEPGSHIDVKFCNDISRIAAALENIAEALDKLPMTLRDIQDAVENAVADAVAAK